jgi:hypothetical protein
MKTCLYNSFIFVLAIINQLLGRMGTVFELSLEFTIQALYHLSTSPISQLLIMKFRLAAGGSHL